MVNNNLHASLAESGVRKKTIAVMCFSSGSGGMERSAIRLAQMLAGHNERVVIFCKKNGFVESLYKQGAYDFDCVPVTFSSRIFSPAMLFCVRSSVDRYGVGNVVFLGASELKTLYFAFLWRDINLVVWHGTTKSKPKRDFVHRLVYSDVRYHVALSGHLLRNVKSIVPESIGVRYKVIMPSVSIKDVGFGRPPGMCDGINLVHVARIANGKGQIDAVLACRYLRDKNIDFSLLLLGESEGDGYAERLKEVVVEERMEERVYFAGNVSNVEEYLSRADVFLFPSRGEGMPGALIEALHFGVVCIVYDNTVFPEFSELGFFIRLVPDGDVDRLGVELLRVIESLVSEKEKSSSNPRLSRKLFNANRELSEWLEILV